MDVIVFRRKPMKNLTGTRTWRVIHWSGYVIAISNWPQFQFLLPGFKTKDSQNKWPLNPYLDVSSVKVIS